MNILLLGGTGRTGKLILKQLLNRGHDVRVIVRDKTKVHALPALTIFEGSTLNEGLLNEAVNGCDAVISALNISRNSDFPWSALRTPKKLMSDTISKLVGIAEKHNVKRIIVISAWGANETRKDIPWWFSWAIRYSNIDFGYLDHERQEDVLAGSTLNWTAIRPVGLINSGAYKPVKVSLNNSPKPSLIISREAVARFTVDVLEQAKFIKQSPVISW